MKLSIVLFSLFLASQNLFPQIPIIGFWGIPANKTSIERYEEMRDCGFDISISTFANMREIDAAMKAANHAQMKVIPWCPAVERNLAANMEKLISYPAFYAYCLGDEPTMKTLPKISRRLSEIRKHNEKIPCYVNLAPCYGDETLKWLGAPSYRKYVSGASAELQLPQISFDFYPVISGRLNTKVRTCWYDNLEIIRQESIRRGVPFWAFVLATSHAVYPKPSIASLRLQIYTNLAYGAKAIQYFTYWTPPFDGKYRYNDGAISEQGRRTDTYTLIKKMNQELKPFSHLFSNGEITEVCHIEKIEKEARILSFLPSVFGSTSVLAPDGVTVSLLQVGKTRYVLWVNGSLSRKMTISNLPVANKQIRRISKQAKPEVLKGKYVLGGGDILLLRYQ